MLSSLTERWCGWAKALVCPKSGQQKRERKKRSHSLIRHLFSYWFFSTFSSFCLFFPLFSLFHPDYPLVFPYLSRLNKGGQKLQQNCFSLCTGVYWRSLSSQLTHQTKPVLHILCTYSHQFHKPVQASAWTCVHFTGNSKFLSQVIPATDAFDGP